MMFLRRQIPDDSIYLREHKQLQRRQLTAQMNELSEMFSV